VIVYNLGNLWRRLVLPKRIDKWSLTSLQQRLVKTGGRLHSGRSGGTLLAGLKLIVEIPEDIQPRAAGQEEDVDHPPLCFWLGGRCGPGHSAIAVQTRT
jgi:hypothetical protein